MSFKHMTCSFLKGAAIKFTQIFAEEKATGSYLEDFIDALKQKI